VRLVTFRNRDEVRVGVCENDVVCDVGAADSAIPQDMLSVIAAGRDMVRRMAAASHAAPQIRLSDVELLAPIPRPAKNIFCVGKNYHEHAREFHASGFDASAGASAVPDVPIVFTKAATAVIGPNQPIPSYLDTTSSVDYENELAVVIGIPGRGISQAQAMSHVFGYTIINDVTSRTQQHRHKQWFIGKNLDGFCPMGPLILTADEVPDVGQMHLLTHVNGEIRQDALVKDLIFDIPTLIETISAGTTLECGDIIATGTPPGVGIGFKPPRYLRKGDLVSLSIEPIGRLENRVE
jgi:2-keto-4-pentenoate hydratase/2-oxohepta-3-ene-1,7-dioic acid hydratase in catechol pathway